LKYKDFIIAATLACYVLLRRNSLVFEGVFTSPHALITQTEAALDLYQQVHKRDVYLGGTPPLGVVKLNWDASLDKNSKRMGVGGLIRDIGGNVLIALSSSIPFVQDPEVAEAVVASQTLTFCCEQGFQKIIFDGDSLNVVKIRLILTYLVEVLDYSFTLSLRLPLDVVHHDLGIASDFQIFSSHLPSNG
jgi:hypothetical protein